MTTVPQMDTYWKKLCSIILGDDAQVVEHLIVDKKELEKFMMYIEDPVQSNTYQILQGVNQIKEKLGI